MPDFVLPSGRIVDLASEPSYGDVCDAEDEAARQARTGRPSVNAFGLSLMASMTGLSISEVRGLSRVDGRALYEEVERRFAQREPSDEAPFEKPSSATSRAARRSTRDR